MFVKPTRYKPGQKFHYWELLRYEKEQKKWLARCVCGKEKLVYIDHLTSGRSKRAIVR